MDGTCSGCKSTASAAAIESYNSSGSRSHFRWHIAHSGRYSTIAHERKPNSTGTIDCSALLFAPPNIAHLPRTVQLYIQLPRHCFSASYCFTDMVDLPNKVLVGHKNYFIRRSFKNGAFSLNMMVSNLFVA